MMNGDTINPGEIWQEYNDYYLGAAGARTIPAPGMPNHYYLFHVATYYDTDGPVILPLSPLYYSLIDMNANNGKGKVIRKNKVLSDKSLTDMALVKHGNGRDWWLTVGVYNEPTQLVWLIDPAGIHGPFEQNIGPAFPELEGLCNSLFSPDGATYIRDDCTNGMRIFDFDRCSGQFSNLRMINLPPGLNGGVYFSPNGRYLYVNSFDYIGSMDLQKPDPATSWDTLAYFDGFASPYLPFSTGFFVGQIEPDNKIWWATTNGTQHLHIMHRPNFPGLSADFEQHGIVLPKTNDGTMCRFPNYRLGRLLNSPCDTLSNPAPPPGFQDYPYLPKDQDITGYKTLSPVKGEPPALDAEELRMRKEGFLEWSMKESIRKAQANRNKTETSKQ